MTRKLVLATIVTLLCLASLPGLGLAKSPKYTAGSAGIGDPYFPGDGNGGYDVIHYDLKVTYEPEHGQAQGRGHDHRDGDPEPLEVQPGLRRPPPQRGQGRRPQGAQRARRARS